MKSVCGLLLLSLLLLLAGSVVEALGDHHDGKEATLMSTTLASLRGVARLMGVQNENEKGIERKLSFVHPAAKTDDDAVASTTSSGKSSGSKSSSTSSTTSDTVESKPTGSIASRTSSVGRRSKTTQMTASVTGTGSGGSQNNASGGSKSKTPSGSGSSTDGSTGASSTVTQTSHGSSSMSQSNYTSSSSSSSSSSSATNSTTSSNSNADPGEPPYKRAFPTVYQYTDDDSWNSHGYAMNHPLNPVVDDILQFLDDDSYKNSTSRLFPKEQDEPAMWPVICLGIFISAAAVLCSTTAYKNYRKRKHYQQIPASLNV